MSPGSGSTAWWSTSGSFSPSTDDHAALIDLVVAELRSASAACAAAGQGPLLGIGIGMAALVSSRTGVVLYSPGLPGWENVPLASMVRECFNVEVLVDDAVRCMALAEKRHGAVRSLDTFLYLYLGAGVGSGIVLDNRMYRGTNGVCGEFGHITVKEICSPPCRQS